jgi:isoleucyl-tRNA synthetase
MKGFRVRRKAGWDTHGLPVELEVEKQLNINGKRDIEKYGVEPFIKRCKESVWKYKAEWERMTERVGYWVDMKNPYITYDDGYIESVWWSLKRIAEKGLLYKGHKVVPYCPRCGTALSSHEVAQGYKDVTDKSAFVKFKASNAENTWYLAWTTTPWTLPSNAALCMNPDARYACIEVTGDCADKSAGIFSAGERYILAEALAPALFPAGYRTLSVKKGAEYERERYEPQFPYAANGEHDAWYVVCDPYVTLTDGSGIVHIAPAFGEDDANVGRRYNLPFIQLVDERGLFTEKAADFAGQFVKDADKDVIRYLHGRNLLFKETRYEHSYPYCWRCDTPLLYYARSSWFIAMTKLRAKLAANNAAVNWIPDSIGKGRMGNFLENVVDWGISRERYWGTPLPVWTCAECGAIEVIGGKEELKARAGITGDIELHKPYVDGVRFKCACGGEMTRVPEVIDCWYDSGSMPFAQYHYPFENADVFEATFPADFISEAVDQTRGWFYTLSAIGALLFGKPAFKNCIVLGHVNDKDGQKMSKHKGNVIDPWTVLDTRGADAVRWYFYTVSNPWLPSRFYEEAVGEVQRKFLGTLWNTYSFYVLYADIDGFNPYSYKLNKCALTLMDRWILSGLETLIKYTDDCLKAYKITESARAVQDFTDNLSNWYVRRCRERYWSGGMTEDKKVAFMTLFTVLERLVRLCAPYIPFMTEMIYQNIVRTVNPSAPESVHLCTFPRANSKLIDGELERGMEVARKLSFLGRGARAAANVKNRQPLSVMLISGEGCRGLPPELSAIVADELNVKRIEYRESLSEYSSAELKPQLKTLGPRYGARLNEIRAALLARPAEIYAEILKTGEYAFDGIVLRREDLLITFVNKAGFSSAADFGFTAALDVRIDDELRAEGFAREIVSKIQTMRKEAGFEVTDRINVTYEADGILPAVFSARSEIAADTLAERVTRGKAGGGYTKNWDINGEPLTLSIEKAHGNGAV